MTEVYGFTQNNLNKNLTNLSSNQIRTIVIFKLVLSLSKKKFPDIQTKGQYG
jgi:hypothetical protein